MSSFDFEGHMAALTGDAPQWPASTRALSELRLSFRVRPSACSAPDQGSSIRTGEASNRVIRADQGKWQSGMAARGKNGRWM